MQRCCNWAIVVVVKPMIRTDKGKEKESRGGNVHWVEGKRVDGVDMVYVVDGLSMAFESVLLTLDFWTWIDKLDCYPSFHTCGRESYSRMPPPHMFQTDQHHSTALRESARCEKPQKRKDREGKETHPVRPSYMPMLSSYTSNYSPSSAPAASYSGCHRCGTIDWPWRPRAGFVRGP